MGIGNKIIMKEVYEKLVENLASMTPEEKEKEWEELKKYNEIGPEVKEILRWATQEDLPDF